MGVSVQTRFDTNLNGAISDVDTAAVLDAAPAFTTGYGTFERGGASEEDVYWGGVSGLQITTMLRGLSQTALTNTEVSGNKKAHLDNVAFEGTLLHYIINDKASKSGNEDVTGAWTFNTQLPTSTDTPGANGELTTKLYVDTADNLKGNLAGGNTWAGTQIYPDGATGPESTTSAAPTSDKKFANKKYVDDTVTGGLATNSVALHATYTPAYMTGGASAESNFAVWDNVTNGSFRATIDGTTYNFDAIDFSAVLSMADVASTMQTKMQTVTSTTCTVVWDTNHFLITSGNTTSSSQVSVLTTSTGTVGTDISGAGATTYMDSETARGTATAAVLNPAADAGKIVKLGSGGSVEPDIAREIIAAGGYTAKGSWMIASAASTPAELLVGADDFAPRADSSQATGIKWAPTSRILGVLNTPVTVANTTTETDLFNVTVPANSLGTTNAILMRMTISDLDVEVSADDNLQLTFELGGTGISSVNIQNGSGAVTNYGGELEVLLTANGATNAQKATMWFDIVETATSVLDFASPPGGTFYRITSTATGTKDSTAALTFAVTATWQGLGAGDSITVSHGACYLIA